MTIEARPICGECFEDTGLTVLARVEADGADVQQSDISSIAYYIYDKSDITTAVASGSLTVATVIFDTLQTDNGWTRDSSGYNFKWDVSALSDPGTYRLEAVLTPTTGPPLAVVAEAKVKGLMGS